MPVTTKDGLLEAWATQIEAMEQDLEALYGPPGITPTLPDVTTYDGMLEAMAEQTETAYINIAKLYGAYHDSITNVYVKTLPSTLLDWFGIKKIGGKTIVMNQLLYNGDFPTGAANWNGDNIAIADGVATLSKTTTSYLAIALNSYKVDIIGGHKYLVLATVSSTAGKMAFMPTGLSGSSSGTKNISGEETMTYFYNPASDNSSSPMTIRFFVTEAGVSETVTATIKNYQCFDLTRMFGSGNEPTTVQQFEEMFGASYYSYNAGSLLSAGVTEVVSKDANNTEKASYPIPAEIQSLTGYGWSAGSVYNYIDYKAKKFIQNVASVDLSTLTWGYGPSVGWSATLNAKNPADDDTVFNGVSDNYTAVSRNTQATAFAGGTDAGMVSVSSGKVYVGTGDIGIVPSGTLYYELDTPVETDISEYITDNTIEVEAEGTLTFVNQHGDDYRIPVPVELEYIGVA